MPQNRSVTLTVRSHPLHHGAALHYAQQGLDYPHWHHNLNNSCRPPQPQPTPGPAPPPPGVSRQRRPATARTPRRAMHPRRCAPAVRPVRRARPPAAPPRWAAPMTARSRGSCGANPHCRKEQEQVMLMAWMFTVPIMRHCSCLVSHCGATGIVWWRLWLCTCHTVHVVRQVRAAGKVGHLAHAWRQMRCESDHMRNNFTSGYNATVALTRRCLGTQNNPCKSHALLHHAMTKTSR